LIPLIRPKARTKNQQLTPLIFDILKCSSRNIRPIWHRTPGTPAPLLLPHHNLEVHQLSATGVVDAGYVDVGTSQGSGDVFDVEEEES
jgi:hypothetical protein